MSDFFKLLVFSSERISHLENAQQFNCTYVQTKEELYSFIENNPLPDALLIHSDNFVNPHTEIQTLSEKIMLKNALEDTVSIKPMLIAITKTEDYEEQLNLMEAGIVSILPLSLPEKFFIGKLKNIILHFEKNQKIVDSSMDQHRDAIKNLVQLDKKTNIYTKQTFITKSKELIEKNPNKSYTLALLDLDRFKVFNDIFGFDEGDKVLEKVGAYFKSAISKQSRYAHIYADRFAILMDEEHLSVETLLEKAFSFAENLHPKFKFIIRIGLYRIKDSNINLAMDRAELALNSIKQDFTTRYAWYNDSMIHNLIEEQELISDMVIGIQNKEFAVYLQPQFDYTTDTLIGAEALVRWIHPKKGIISPGLFIPVFERNGFITQLDHFVWEEACRLLQEWIKKGLNPVPVSVNISRRDIYDPNLVTIFDNLLEKYNLSPRLLRLEITESAYMDNPSQLIQVVEKLREHGFCLEMDDFGSGYSSLNTLKEVPVDILKLDMKFIASSTSGIEDGSEESSKGGSILSSVVRMASYLNMPVIAEGIESKEQADYLKSIGCFQMQGFYFAKPMPVANYENLLTDLPVFYEERNTNSEINMATAFLDAKTQATVLFNSFVGGAAIIEWIGQTVEVMRMNDQFLEELGTTRETYEKHRANILPHIEERSRKVFLDTLAEVTRTKKPSFCEILCQPPFNNSKPFWLRAHLRHLGKTITSDIYYLSIDNIDFRMQLLQLNSNLSEQLSTIMENVPCGILTLNYGKNISLSYSNETATKLSGYSISEFRTITNSSPLELFTKEDKIHLQNLIENAVEKKERSFSTPAILQCKDNSQKQVQTSGNIFERSDGTILVNLMFMEMED